MTAKQHLSDTVSLGTKIPLSQLENKKPSKYYTSLTARLEHLCFFPEQKDLSFLPQTSWTNKMVSQSVLEE